MDTLNILNICVYISDLKLDPSVDVQLATRASRKSKLNIYLLLTSYLY